MQTLAVVSNLLAIGTKLNCGVKYQGSYRFDRKFIFNNFMEKNIKYDVLGMFGLIYNYANNKNNITGCILSLSLFFKYGPMGDTYRRLE